MRVGSYAGVSDTGRRRRRNEDSYVVAPPLFAVADGMGGAQAGEVASKLAAAVLRAPADGRLAGIERLAALIREANRRVYERSTVDPATSGMGTTMTVALVEGSVVAIGHVGDSRAYLLRAGRMEQLTDDHSLVNELLKSGKLSPEEAELHPQRSVITRAVGTDPEVDVDAFTIDVEVGDVFLLCSDGLTDMVEDEEILDLLERHADDLDRATRALVSAANRGGGEDNVTAVAFRIAGDGADTLSLPPIAGPDEQTLESAAPLPASGDTIVIPAGNPEQELLESSTPAAPVRVRRAPDNLRGRARIVLTIVALLAIAIGLLVWGLVR